MGLSGRLEDETETDVVAGAVARVAKGLARVSIPHVVHQVVSDRPGMAGSQTRRVGPRGGCRGVGEPLGARYLVIDCVQSNKYVLIVGGNKVKPGEMRV